MNPWSWSIPNYNYGKENRNKPHTKTHHNAQEVTIDLPYSCVGIGQRVTTDGHGVNFVCSIMKDVWHLTTRISSPNCSPF